MRNLRTTLTAGVAGLLVVALAGPAAARPPGPAGIDGVWRSDGYGMVVAVDGDRATLYETTGIGCAAGPVATRVAGARPARFEMAETGFTVRPAARRDGLVLHLDGSAGDRQLRRLPGLPAACTGPSPTGPLATFDVFWQTYAENYPFFAAKGVDWRAVRERYRPRVRPDMSDGELFDLLVAMIEPLGDAHTGLRAEDREFVGHRPGTTFPSPELEQRVRPFIERRDLGGPLRDFGAGRIGYADLPGRLGYLRLIAFAGYTEQETFAADLAELDRALDAVLTPARTSGPAALRGLVIDLRVNGGGHDALGLHLAGRLTDRAYHAYTKAARNDPDDPARFTRPQPILVRPGGGPAYTGPVAILTGGSTISAGETFTQATLGRSPRPVRIGEPTQGVFSDTLIRSLPNGWMFILPNEEFRTRDGRTFDGTGIPPHVATPVFTAEEFARDRDSAFDRAVALLSRR